MKKKGETMFKKLKRNSVIALSCSVTLLIFCYLMVNYISYRNLLYNDYISKVSALSEMHADNIDAFFDQLGMNTSIFLHDHKSREIADTMATNNRAQFSDAIANIVKHWGNTGMDDIMLVNTAGDYVSYSGRLNYDALNTLGILREAKMRKNSIIYTAGKKIAVDFSGKPISKPDSLIYSETVYDDEGYPLFYIIELMNMNVFKKVLSTDEYFTKDTSVYIDFGDTAYDITNLKRVRNESLNIRNNRSKINKNKIFQTRRYNRKYNISVVTNTRSSDNSLFISIMKPMIVVILLTVGIVCFLCARLIVGFILEPLEGISIKMKHFK